MAKISRCLWGLLFLSLSYTAGVSQTGLRQVYTSQLGVRELTGHNDGKAVEMYLHSVGSSKGNPWCAAFVHWCMQAASVKNKITAWSPTSMNQNHLLWSGHKIIEEPKPGDVFSLWFPRLRRIAHTGFYDGRINATVYQTVEGNTNQAGSREGDGVYRKYRAFRATYAISRWP